MAAVLKESETQPQLLQQRISIAKSDLVVWSPITEQHVNGAMTIKQLSAASITHSDNAAMNILLKQIGGVQKVNYFARTIGDESFKLNHTWPDEAASNLLDQEDATTPAAMAKSLQRLALGDALAPLSRQQLLTWLQQSVTGKNRIRAGVPSTWQVADKTGSGFQYGTTNDIAIVWPQGCAPIVLAIYYSSLNKHAKKQEALIAEATRTVMREFARHDQCIRNTL